MQLIQPDYESSRSQPKCCQQLLNHYDLAASRSSTLSWMHRNVLDAVCELMILVSGHMK
jgi:hypothetical protein